MAFPRDHKNNNPRISGKIDELIEQTIGSNLNFRVAIIGQSNTYPESRNYNEKLESNTTEWTSTGSVY